MKIRIKSRDGEVIYSTEADSVIDAVAKAMKDGADLARADLARADLARAALAGANLRGADLARADLRDADLACADLRDADLRGAALAGAKGLPDAPVVDGLDAKILAAIDAGGSLNMSSWHGTYEEPCGTTHCRAGWAIVLAGEEGKALEAKLGPAVAGALIYLASTGRVPNFYADDEAAMADIKRCAAGAS